MLSVLICSRWAGRLRKASLRVSNVATEVEGLNELMSAGRIPAEMESGQSWFRLSLVLSVGAFEGEISRRSYGISLATVGSLESKRNEIGVFSGRSTFEPLAINASQILFAAPK